MAICNQLNVRFNRQEIDNTFDFYLINTTEKYIPFGAKCLDFETGKIESLAFYLLINLLYLFMTMQVREID